MREWLRYAGLFAAPAVWAADVQLGQLLPYPDCAGQMRWSLVATWLSCAVSLATAALSFAGARRLAGTEHFLGLMGGLVGLAFSFALLLQGLATVIVDPCWR